MIVVVTFTAKLLDKTKLEFRAVEQLSTVTTSFMSRWTLRTTLQDLRDGKTYKITSVLRINVGQDVTIYLRYVRQNVSLITSAVERYNICSTKKKIWKNVYDICTTKLLNICRITKRLGKLWKHYIWRKIKGFAKLLWHLYDQTFKTSAGLQNVLENFENITFGGK